MIYDQQWQTDITILFGEMEKLRSEIDGIPNKPPGLHDHIALSDLRDRIVILAEKVFTCSDYYTRMTLRYLAGDERADFAARIQKCKSLEEIRSVYPSISFRIPYVFKKFPGYIPDAVTEYIDYEEKRACRSVDSLRLVRKLCDDFDVKWGFIDTDVRASLNALEENLREPPTMD